MSTRNENFIVLLGVKYNLIPSKEKKQNCCECDLKQICEEKLDINSMLCKIFDINTKLNGYFKKDDVVGKSIVKIN